MDDQGMSKGIFWKLTEEIFGETFFDDENVTKEEIRNKLFQRMREDVRLRNSPVYDYWMKRTMFDLFENEETVNSPQMIH